MNDLHATSLQPGVGGPCILCVIDFSETSKVALKTALAIAQSTKSALTALYAYRLNQPGVVSNVADWKKTIDSNATKNFNQMTKAILVDSDVACDFKSEVGFVDDRIEAFTHKNNVRVVVMSADLARNTDGALMDMLDRLVCPLLIVPNDQNK